MVKALRERRVKHTTRYLSFFTDGTAFTILRGAAVDTRKHCKRKFTNVFIGL